MNGYVSEFAKLLGISDWKAALWLQNRGVMVNSETGVFDTEELLSLPEVHIKNTKRTLSNASLIAKEREYLRRRLSQVGLIYQGRDFPRGSLLKFKRKDGMPVNVLSYIAISMFRPKQASFQVSHLLNPEVHWVVCVASSLKRTLIYSRQELSNGADRASLTVTAGTPLDRDWENRIHLLI